MISRRLLLGAAAVVLSCGGSVAAKAQTEIQWWHAMGGQLGEALNALADGFNKSQKDYKVVPVYKGTYTETMTGAIAAFRAKQQPHIVQVFEVGTATMMAAKGAIYPVHQLMADAGETFDPNAYLPAVYGYYSTTDGKLLSMPFNSSTPVLYYNKDAFKKAGLDPDKPPKTWPDMEQYSQEAPGRRLPVRLHQPVADLDADREFRRLAQRSICHRGQRLRRDRHQAHDQRSAARPSRREPGQVAKGEDVRLCRPRG